MNLFFIILLGVVISLFVLLFVNIKAIRVAQERVKYLESVLEEECRNGTKIELQEKYQKLEKKVIDLKASAQELGNAESTEEQISQLENFFALHFKTMPPYMPKFCKRMRRMVQADERIQQLHSQVMRPLQGMLYTQEVTDDPDVQRMVLARMLDAMWLAFDAVETIADGDNVRAEQHLAIDLISGKSTRSQVLSEAKVVTTNPEETPKWVRVIRRAVLPLHLDEQYSVLYSGYKIEPLKKDEESKEH